MRCRWCCNPESQKHDIQTMQIQGKSKTIGRDVTVKEVIEIVEKDRPYYRRSGGGLTLSGGEVLFQANFAKDLLQAAQSVGLHTAIESTGFSSYENIEKLLPYIDQFLMDIKHTNSAKHEEYTGKANAIILENARKIVNSGLTELVIRIPIIPQFNDSIDEMRDIATFVESLKAVKKIHLLPYHRLGQDKYTALDMPYLMQDLIPPTDDHMQLLKKIVESYTSSYCQIGG